MVGRSKLLDDGPLCKSHIILVGRYYAIGILVCGTLNHCKERRWHLLAVDNECTTENLMATVLRVYLSKAEYLAIGKFATKLTFDAMQIIDFLFRECQSFGLVVAVKILDKLNRLRLDADFKDTLVESFIHSLKHRIVLGILVLNREILLDTHNTFDTHILGNLYSICTPRSNHLATWANEIAL